MNNKTLKLLQEIPQAPPSIRKYVRGRQWSENKTGWSTSRVFQTASGSPGMVIKIHPFSDPMSFSHEVDILNWLIDKLPVPEVIAYERDSTREYLVLSMIPGKDGVASMRTFPEKQLVSLLARGLRVVHSVDISDCPFDERVAAKLQNAGSNIRNGLVDESDFDNERQGWSAEQVLQALKNHQPPEDDPVFCHGDYCLPNILFHNNQISGYIDLGRAGVSDRWNDLAIASRSIRYNLGAPYDEIFFDFYGIDKVDWERIEYYRMMDELF